MRVTSCCEPATVIFWLECLVQSRSPLESIDRSIIFSIMISTVYNENMCHLPEAVQHRSL